MHHRSIRMSALAAAMLAALPGTAWAIRVDYTLDAGIERNNNVALTAENPIEERIWRTGLGFVVSEDTSTVQAALDGRIDYRDYPDNVFSDSVDSTFNGRVNWNVLPERLSLVFEDNLQMEPVDALVPDAPANRQRVNVLSLGPNAYFRWSPTLQAQAELRYIDTNAEVTDEFNSGRVSAAFRVAREFSPTDRLSFNAQAQRVDFDHDDLARDHNRYDLFARYTRLLAHFDLGVDLGYSRIDYRGAENTSEPLARVDIGWNATSRSRLALHAASQFLDTATDALSGVGTLAETVPENIITGTTVINASPYRTRRLELAYTYAGARTNLSVAPRRERRDYLDADEFDQDLEGVDATVSWLARPHVQLGLAASHERNEFYRTGRDFRTRRFAASVQYTWNRNWSMGFEVSRYQRRTNEPGLNVSQNVAYLNITYRNR